MNIIPMPGFIMVEPVLRSEGRTTTIKGFEFGKPEFEGPPNMGTVYALPPEGFTDLAVGDVIVFRNEPLPQGFTFGKLKLFAVPFDSVAGKVKGD